MEDFIDDLFSSVDQYYPGSKRKKKSVVDEKPKVKEETSWDNHPHVKTLPNGRDVEFFTLGDLAKALGRPIITVRTWTNKGQLPQPPYRMPSVEDKNGKMWIGRRLYSRPMVEVAVEVFERNGLLNLSRIEWSQYQQVTNDIAEAWGNIRADENNNTEN